MITSEFPPLSGGVGYYVYNLSKKLVEKGYLVTVITRGSSFKASNELINGVGIFKVPFFPLYPLHVPLLGASINRQFRSLESKFEVVHTHTPMPLPIKTSLPIVTTVHTPMKIDSRYYEVFDFYSLAAKVQAKVIYPPVEQRLLKLSQTITSVSRTVAEELREYGVDPNKVAVVGNGVDEKIFAPTKNRRSVSPYILYTGVLRARKGLFDLLECAKYVCKKHPDVKFVICGKGPFAGKVQEKIRRMKLQEKVVLLGYVKRECLIQIYQEATIQVIPSHYEGLPTVLLEAMSCGLPVVATDIGGNNEVITSGANGILVPPKSPVEMAEGVSRLLDDPAMRRRIGEEARRTVKKRFTWDKIAQEFLQCYEKMV